VTRMATLASLILLSSCEVRDVTVFELPGAGSGGTTGAAGTGQIGGAGSAAQMAGAAGKPGGSGGSGMICVANADCPQGWFCEKPSCADPTGSCELRPTKPTLDYAPVCGCDGVTYWNDVTRRQAGTTLLQAEQCSTTAKPCNNSVDCGTAFASCARLVSRGESCAPWSLGACWLLPPDCPDPRSDPDVWRDCRPPIQGLPPPPCVDTCRAIRVEFPHQRPPDLAMCR
jgi:hypothetical protein